MQEYCFTFITVSSAIQKPTGGRVCSGVILTRPVYTGGAVNVIPTDFYINSQ